MQDARILIVDDEPANVRLLERLLAREGYTDLEGVTDPRRVVDQCVASPPDLILLDLRMPYLDGFAVLSQLRAKLPAGTYLPVLVLTADTTPEAKQRALASGANDFLTKPFDPIEVVLRTRNLLETRYLHQQLQQQNEQLEEKVRERTHELAQLLAVTDAALAHLELDALLDALLGRIQPMLAVDTAAILMLDEDRQELATRAAKGLEEEVERGIRIPVGRGFAGRIAAEQRPVCIADVDHADVLNPLLRERGVRSLLGVPLVVAGRVIGVLHVGTLYRRDFTPDDTRLLQLVADRAALAIDHARAYDEMKSALAIRDQFLVIASHELRTPLTPLKGLLQLAHFRLTRREYEPLKRYLVRADVQADRLGGLVTSLLDVSRIASGRFVVECEPVALLPLIERVLEVTRVMEPDRTITLTTPDAPVVALADPARLEQVLMNLLANACKYSPPEMPIRVHVQAEPHETAIAVQDEGIGIPADEQQRIFERFHRADNIDRHVSGLGLGLFIARQIVEAHGGSLRVDSAPGRGSTFTVRLPRHTPAAMPE